MADDNTIIEGTVKFRDGKKWKSRWCVMRKLSPVADCVHLQVYRDSKARWGGAASKASLSLQQYLGCEAGFTLDKHSHTLALLCRDFTAVLAFETRERLMQWQVKVNTQLGEARQYLVLVGSAAAGNATAGKRLPAGPARLHLHQRRFALTSGVPPRLLGVWEIAHLRRYGVIDGRFCFEGGSHCGKGEGLHVLVSDQAQEIASDFDLASRGQLSPRRRSSSTRKIPGTSKNNSLKKNEFRSFELKTIDRSLPPSDLRLYEDPCIRDEAGAISPYWPSAERTNFQDLGLGDTASVNEALDGTDMTPWNGNGNVMLERCMSCISKLGALSRSSTAALTPGAKHFAPAWTMEAVNEPLNEFGANNNSQDSDIVHSVNKTEDVCRCSLDKPPERPPKPTRLELHFGKRPPMPLPIRSFSHAHLSSIGEDTSTNPGPYENYDVPKIPSAEVDGEYYDTPKRLKECINNDLFRITKNSNSSTLILKKPCGCLLKFGKKPKQPTIIDTEESFQQASCPCQRVTDWANNWIKLPYCKSTSDNNEDPVPNKENLKPIVSDRNALYATIDLSRKTKRKALQEGSLDPGDLMTIDSKSIEIDEGPLANYENLNFALSLEHYENAKDLLKKAGVTQSELNAISANLRPSMTFKTISNKNTCSKCGHPQQDRNSKCTKRVSNDEYLLMEPNSLESNKFDQNKSLLSGYTPMSPIGSFAFHTLKYPAKSPISRLLDEKSASNPTLCRPEDSKSGIASTGEVVETRGIHEHTEYRKRSSSADSSRFLEDVKEFDGSVGSRGSASSIETLRDLGARESSTPCDCATSKHSDADSSEASKAKGCITVTAGGNRDSSSSNDSGVSSWSLRGELAAGAGEFELPATTAAARRRYRSARRATTSPRVAPRRSRSSGPERDSPPATHKCCSAEAEVPVLTVKPLRGVMDTHSTSSGTSDMSDYIETLSICSSHSSSDTPITMRVMRQTTSTLRPRSGKEYRPLAHPHLYSNLP